MENDRSKAAMEASDRSKRVSDVTSSLPSSVTWAIDNDVRKFAKFDPKKSFSGEPLCKQSPFDMKPSSWPNFISQLTN